MNVNVTGFDIGGALGIYFVFFFLIFLVLGFYYVYLNSVFPLVKFEVIDKGNKYKITMRRMGDQLFRRNVIELFIRGQQLLPDAVEPLPRYDYLRQNGKERTYLGVYAGGKIVPFHIDEELKKINVDGLADGIRIGARFIEMKERAEKLTDKKQTLAVQLASIFSLGLLILGVGAVLLGVMWLLNGLMEKMSNTMILVSQQLAAFPDGVHWYFDTQGNVCSVESRRSAVVVMNTTNSTNTTASGGG